MARFLRARITALVLLFGASAHAEDELRHDVAIDTGITLTTFGLFVGSELGKDDLGPSACRWCDAPSLDQNTRSLRWSHPRNAAITSDLLLFGIAPANAFGGLALASKGPELGVDALIVAEAVGVELLVTQTVKLLAARERPFARFARRDDVWPSHADDHMSFFSGHAATTFTFASATGAVASMRGYELAPVLWASGLGIAAVTSYLRIAADKHYLTDVLTGAIVGSLIGTLLPVVFHSRRDPAEPNL